MTYADRNPEHHRMGSDKQKQCEGLSSLIGA
jgi:hypothetical protein